jgi:hypothetical protein
MAPLTAAEIIAHPEFSKVTWDLKSTKQGIAEVGEGRGGPYDISYEIHGTGEICLVVRTDFHATRRTDIQSINSLFLSLMSCFSLLLLLSESLF